MQLIPFIPDYEKDVPANCVWEILQELFGENDGLAFYRHPNLGPGNGVLPDIAILVENYGAVAVKVVGYELENVEVVDVDTWQVDNKLIVSPLTELDDLRVHLEYRFKQDRRIRGKIPVSVIFAWPNIRKDDYCKKFGDFRAGIHSIWQNKDAYDLPSEQETPTGELWKLAKSIFQAVSPLNHHAPVDSPTSNNLGPAIRILERNIALLDERQTKGAMQIPPGPQRIRGLAGTGKTILLAMKAANIHSHYPDAKILFSFNTQSLYNQTKEYITKFYRVNKPCDPDWSVVHIRHGWGSKARNGVYSDICSRQGITPYSYNAAKNIDRAMPFRACCKQVLENPIEPEYDFVLLDEAQDFPREFFYILRELAKGSEKRIYFAYDELQSLTHTEIPNAMDLFGNDKDGKPLIDLTGEYRGGMEKDLVLYKSYRCPDEVLMLAHGIGLGIHNTEGCIQMISDMRTWQAIGYEITSGQLENGRDVEIKRPTENSPNNIRDIYQGDQQTIIHKGFDRRKEELKWVANSIERDIREESVSPEQIVVISLDSILARKYMSNLQASLLDKGIASLVPGLVDPADEFAEVGKVTLSTVYRAKGNEAPIIYIISFDSLYEYVHEIEMRNRAFTSISRAKGWVRITGCGSNMERACDEIRKIMDDIPYFKFVFPDMTRIMRNLDTAEGDRRRKEVRAAKRSIKDLVDIDIGALSNLNPSEIAVVLKKLQQIQEKKGGSSQNND